MNMRKTSLIIVFLIASLCSMAQVSVEMKIDSLQMLIGEQTDLSVKVVMNKGGRLTFPRLRASQYITPGVEVVEVHNADTVEQENGQLEITKRYTLTSFDENVYLIPSQTIRVNGKTFSTNKLALKVLAVDVDTLHKDKFFPAKGVQSNPFDWQDFKEAFYFSLLLLVVFALGVYLYICLKQQKVIIPRLRFIQHVPPHQKAMQAIERIKSDKLLLSDDQKTYYTELTDVLRQYIQERFGFNAKEMTTPEIIEHLQSTQDGRMVEELRELFSTADLVKFAKYSTHLSEKDNNLMKAIEFVNQTKVEGEQAKRIIEKDISQEEEQSIKTRGFTKAMFICALVIGIAILVYTVYIMYGLLVE